MELRIFAASADAQLMMTLSFAVHARTEVKQSVRLEQLWSIRFRGGDPPKLLSDTLFRPYIRVRIATLIGNPTLIRVA